MKRIVAISMALLFVFALTACGSAPASGMATHNNTTHTDSFPAAENSAAMTTNIAEVAGNNNANNEMKEYDVLRRIARGSMDPNVVVGEFTVANVNVVADGESGLYCHCFIALENDRFAVTLRASSAEYALYHVGDRISCEIKIGNRNPVDKLYSDDFVRDVNGYEFKCAVQALIDKTAFSVNK